MSDTSPNSAEAATDVDLKNPCIAGFLALLFPGLGHIYQGRIGKGLIFSVCILGLFFYGVFLSSGHDVGWGRSVYCNWQPNDKRYFFFAQMFVGLPAAPALIQSYIVQSGAAPILNGLMAPPCATEQAEPKTNYTFHEIRKALNKNFELGTIYAVIAGLLNLLVVFDAIGGVVVEPDKSKANGLL